MSGAGDQRARRIAGRYALLDEIASGGMATVHLGRLLRAGGFARTVAIKRLRPSYARDTDFVAMFLDEARLASRVRHPNVVPTLDVLTEDGEVFLVMEYVAGRSLHALYEWVHADGERVPLPVLARIVCGALAGLHAAHEAVDEQGRSLHLVHRDVTPHNVIVDVEGVARVLDFGIAKAAGRLQQTIDGQLKGKPSYMAPEQVEGGECDRRVDLYSTSAVFWEGIVGERIFGDTTDAFETLTRLMSEPVPTPTSRGADIGAELEAVVMKGLAPVPGQRYATALEMVEAIEAVVPPATARQTAEWLERVAGPELRRAGARVRQLEQATLPDADDADGAPAASGPGTPVDLRRQAPSSAAPPVTGPPRARRAMLVTVPVAVAAVGALAWAITGLRARPVDAARAADAPATPSAPASAATAAPSVEMPRVARPPSSAAVALPAPSASVAPPRPRPQPARPRPQAPPRPDPCAAPFVVDESGIKRIKPECR